MALTPRIVLGPRGNGDVGIFVSPPGVDAHTAADSALILNVSQKVSQLILLGSIAAPGGTVTLGLGAKPFVFLTSDWNFSGVAGHTFGDGPMRPSPTLSGGSNATINSGGASMTISSTTRTVYAVFSASF